jgi:hypothetical protein
MMVDVAKYLMAEYFAKLFPDKAQDEQMLVTALNLHRDKVIVVHENGEITGAAVFLTLSDETFSRLKEFDLSSIPVLQELLKETGKNYHFILLTARNISDILIGKKVLLRERHPKTISWWTPDMKRFIKFSLN